MERNPATSPPMANIPATPRALELETNREPRDGIGIATLHGPSRFGAEAPAHAPATAYHPEPPQVVPQRLDIAEIHAKTSTDYLRALRRHWLLAATLAVAVFVPGAIYTMRKPPIYRVDAMIEVTPPEFKTALQTLLSDKASAGPRESSESLLPNYVAYLRSKSIAQAVELNLLAAKAVPPSAKPAEDLAESLSVKLPPKSQYIQLELEGEEPGYIANVLTELLSAFERQIRDQRSGDLDDVERSAAGSIAKREQEIRKIDEEINGILAASKTIDSKGESLLEPEISICQTMILQEQNRKANLEQQFVLQEAAPSNKPDRRASFLEDQIFQLTNENSRYRAYLDRKRERLRNASDDPHVKEILAILRANEVEIRRLEAQLDRPPLEDDAQKEFYAAARESIMTQIDDNIAMWTKRMEDLRVENKEEAALRAKYRALVEARQNKVVSLEEAKGKLLSFQMLSENQKRSSPVVVHQSPRVSDKPVRPSRPLFLAFFLVLGTGLGLGVVCLREHFDHSVKSPEPLMLGLSSPILGMIPRVPWTSRVNRGGHLWTPGDPNSPGADAFRNLRAGLVGADDLHGRHRTLLFTSGHPGEGKSTVAVNLAANCARAGERAVIVEVDLRNPSLARAFPPLDDEIDREDLGLVDVLRDGLPWQTVVRRTGTPNLDYLPVGDVEGDEIPAEILGTRELRQLLASLAQHYDRVILDGPAVLGLADCRLLGRFVDAALLVVKAGVHDLKTLRRAKLVLEQSHIHVLGLVLNMSDEKNENWSGPLTYLPHARVSATARALNRSRDRADESDAPF